MVIRELVWKITGDPSSALKALKDTDKAGDKTATTFSRLKNVALGLTGAVAGFGVALQRVVSKHLDAIDASAKLADRLGISMEAMGGLEHMASITGTSVESFGAATQMLTLRMGEAQNGTGEARAAIERLGLSFNEISSQSPDQALFKLAGALQGVQSSTQQAAIANELFGRGGRALLGVIRSEGSNLQNLSDEARALGLTMSREAAAGVERFNDQMTRVSAVGTGMWRQLTIQLTPSLNGLADALLDSVAPGGSMALALSSIGDAASWAIDKISGFLRILNDMARDAGRANDVFNMGQTIDVTDSSAPVGSDAWAIEHYGSVANYRRITASANNRRPAGPAGGAGAGGESAEERRLRIAEELKRAATEMNNVMTNQEMTELKINAIYQQRIGLLSTANEVAQAGLQVISALGSLSAAQNQAKIDNLDRELEAELASRGLLEETQVEQAQREYDAALALGDAVQLEEKRRQLEKAKIEEEYRKKKAKLEYQAAMDAYKYRMIDAAAGVPLAIMSGLISGWRAPWPLGAVFGPLYATLAGAAALIQVAAVRAAKPQAPKFATGGIVPGNSYVGDTVSAQVNSGEMVLNNQQQSRLFNLANGAGGAVQQIMIYLGGQKIYDEFHRASSDGRLLIDARAVV